MPFDFSTARFAFDEQEVGLERRTISGSVALSGDEDVIAVDGGGRVFAEFAGGPLLEREEMLAWRAFAALAEEGANEFIVPFCDPEHQPYLTDHVVAHEDGSEFEDDPDYIGGGVTPQVFAAAVLRATTLSLLITPNRMLLGGEWLSIQHETKGWRAYKIAEMVEQDTTTAVVKVRPPLREAVQAETPVDFANPRCLMRVEGRVSTRTELGRFGEAAVRFVEAP